MPTPTTPQLTLSRTSSTSFQASIVGTAGVTHRLFYKRLDNGSLETGTTRVGDGTIDQAGLTSFGQYLVYVVSDDAGSLSYPALGFVSLVVSDDMLAAVKTRWNSFPSLAEAAGRVYVNEVPERDSEGNPVEIPYTYADLSRTTYEFTMEDDYYEYAEISFTTFSVGSDLASAAKDAIKNVFDWKTLPLVTSRSIQLVPTDHHIASEDIRYKDGSLIYRSQVCYQICIERHLNN